MCMIKLCNKCRVEKELTEYNKKCDTKDGYRNICRECQKNSRDKNKDSVTYKKWAADNKVNRKEYMREFRKQHPTVKKVRLKQTIEEKREKARLYFAERRKDPLYRFRKNIQRNLINSFKRVNKIKNSKTQTIIGCTFEEFKAHIESLWEPWMTWENYGLYNGEPNYGWDLDHIIPSSLAENEEGVIALNHYTNLQPLCSKINRAVKQDNIF